MFCFHKWKITALAHVNHYKSRTSARPYMITTEVSQICEKCGKPRVKKMNGAFEMGGGGHDSSR